MAAPSHSRSAASRGWRGIRPRLVAVLLVPTIAALGLGALRVQAAVSESAEAARAESIAAILPDSFRLAVQLTVEREANGADLAALSLAEVRAVTDDDVATWRAHLPRIDHTGNAALQGDLSAIVGALDGLADLRKRADDPQSRKQAQSEYTTTLNLLIGLSNRLPRLDDDLVYRHADALSTIRTASEALGTQRVLMGKSLSADRIDADDLTALIRAQTDWATASGAFYARTSAAAQASFDKITSGTSAEGSRDVPMQQAVDKVVSTGDISSPQLSLSEWQKVSTAFVTRMLDVIVQAASDLADEVTAHREAAQRAAVQNALIVFLVLLAALAVAMFAARSIVRPLGQLRLAALDIANQKLPARVRQLEQADEQVEVSVEPLGIGHRDEIAEVAEAFDAVHAEAIRLAGEQTQMRANVNRMFVNLSRRSQSLVERQLSLIDRLEANEQDPDDLANLFRLDHLATRMRRNDESLLVLAGGDTGQASRGDVPVLDVLRAACSEIEQFARVEIDSSDTAMFQGQVAGDLVHLLAELIENATNFSPPDTPVVVRTARGAPAGSLIVEVRDIGIGMTLGELAAANAKLQRTRGLDADVARMMGLVVVSRLAARHGLSVELGSNSPKGVIARVQLPASVFAQQQPEPVTRPRRTQTGYLYAESPVRNAARIEVSTRPPTTTVPRTEDWFGGTTPAAQVSTPRLPQRPPASRRPATTALDLPAKAPEDFAPIFATLRSEWFSRRPNGAQPAPPVPDGTGPAPEGWTSPGDEGWRRAAELADQQAQEPAAVTAGGLPVRVPGKNLIPGTAPAEPPPAATHRRDPDPDRARGLSSFQQGVTRARNPGATDSAEDAVPHDEEQK
jgi:signal transduction histidine kinase